MYIVHCKRTRYYIIHTNEDKRDWCEMKKKTILFLKENLFSSLTVRKINTEV